MKTIITLPAITLATLLSFTALASTAPACPANEQAVCSSASAIPSCVDQDNKATSSETTCPTGSIPACKTLGAMTVAICKPLK